MSNLNIIFHNQISANIVKFCVSYRFNGDYPTLYQVWLNRKDNTFIMIEIGKTLSFFPRKDSFVDFSKLNRELFDKFKYQMLDEIGRYDFDPQDSLKLYDYFAIKMLKDDYIGLTCDLLPIFAQNCDGNYIFSTIKNGVEYDLVIGAEKKSISLLVNGQPTVTFAYLSPYFAIDLIASLDLT